MIEQSVILVYSGLGIVLGGALIMFLLQSIKIPTIIVIIGFALMIIGAFVQGGEIEKQSEINNQLIENASCDELITLHGNFTSTELKEKTLAKFTFNCNANAGRILP